MTWKIPSNCFIQNRVITPLWHFLNGIDYRAKTCRHIYFRKDDKMNFFYNFQVLPPEPECSGVTEPAMSIVELPTGAEVPPETEFPRSGRVSVTEPDDDITQVRRREKDIKTKRKLNETPSMLDPVIFCLSRGSNLRPCNPYIEYLTWVNNDITTLFLRALSTWTGD